MPKILILDIRGIKCDHCDYRNDEVIIEEYYLWLNKSCPKCGSNLLTEEDFRLTNRIMNIAHVINFFFGWLAYFNKKNWYRSKIEMNGTGTAKVSESVKVEKP